MATITERGISIHSIAFSQNGHIPKKYSCEGENINPPLEFSGFPEETESFALVVEDPDAVHPVFVHWLLWNILPNESISEGNTPGISGRNGSGNTGYTGPCPPSGTHRYFFRAYALDITLDLAEGSDKTAFDNAMNGHILASGELMAVYKKDK